MKAFEFGGGLTEIVVPDNLKAGVSRPCRYEPDLNPTFTGKDPTEEDIAEAAKIYAEMDKPR